MIIKSSLVTNTKIPKFSKKAKVFFNLPTIIVNIGKEQFFYPKSVPT